MKMKTENPYLCAWATMDKLTFLRYQKIKNYYDNLENAWEHSNLQNLVLAGIETKVAEQIMEMKKKIIPEKELEKIQKLDINLISFDDSNYPLLLKEISSPPVFLYVKGELFAEEICLAVVGSRQASLYGKQITKDLVQDLALQSLTIVSGLALGIDSLAHQSALKTEARTIAVLGNGLDSIYPVENYKLAHQIMENGAIISEFPLGTPPNHYNFPRRNRIISGLSLGVLIVEAKLKSGSLITARNAIEQNREVFAVPGSLYNQKSEGVNYLIQKGEAKLIRQADDILEELNLNLVKSQNTVKQLPDFSDLNLLESQILNFLSDDPLLFDILKSKVDFNTAELTSSLTLLEMKGFVSNLGNNQWVKSF